MTDARKAFLEMIEDAGKEWSVVLTYDVSRFGRVGTDEAGYYRHQIAQKGAEVIYIAEDFRGDDTDDLIRSTKQWLAHRMVVDLSKVTIRGQLSRVNKGRWCGGRPPFGYDLCYFDGDDRPYAIIRYMGNGDREVRDPASGEVTRVVRRGEDAPVTSTDRAQLIPGDPDRVRVIKRIFALYLTGEMGLAKIAAALNADGIPSPLAGTRGDGRWSLGTIRELLRNPSYRGATAWNRVSYAKFHRVEDEQPVRKEKGCSAKVRRNPKDQWVVVEHTHAPLIPPRDFERAQRVIRSRSGCSGGKGRMTSGRSVYLLSGLVRCKRCQHRWQGRKVTKGRARKDGTQVVTRYYGCGGYITKGNAGCARCFVPQEEFEGVVMDEVAQHLERFVADGGREMLEEMVLDALQPAGVQKTEKSLRLAIENDRTRLDGLADSLTPALIPVLEPKILALRQKIADREAELEDRKEARVTEERARELVETVVGRLGGIGDLLRRGTLLEKRDVLRGVVQEITLDPENGVAELVVRRLPLLPGCEESRELEALGSSCTMAGARHDAIESRFQADSARVFRVRRMSA